MKRSIVILLTLFVAVPLLADGKKTLPPATHTTGSVVIVFENGNRQVIDMADVERIEFSQSVLAACASSGASDQTLFRRDRCIRKWQAQGDSTNPAVYMTLKPDGHATRGAGHGTWN